MYYYATIPLGIKYKVIKWDKKILENIVKKHQEKLKEYWTKLDTVILKHQDNYYLVLEQTEEEIVEDIKKRLKEKANKIKEKLMIDNQDYLKLITLTKNYKYISEFYDDITKLLLWFEFPDLELLYEDVRNPLNKVFNIQEELPKKKVKLNYVNKQTDLSDIDIDDILKINILDVLDKCWIEYKRVWANTYMLYEDWRRTDWWRANTEKNIITDFARKWRAEWNPFAFVRKYYNLSDKETFIWFKENFNL